MKTPLRFCLVTLATVLGVGITLALGAWQYGRGLTMQAQDAALAQQGRLAPISNTGLLALTAPAQAVHRTVRLRGHWLGPRTVFLDNRPMNGKAGLIVLTPLQLDGAVSVLMVQRGWVARNFLDRSALPQVATPSGLVEIEGRIAPWPSKLYEMGGSGAGPIRQNLDWAQFRAESGLPAMEVTVKQTDSQTDGLVRDWPEAQVTLRKHFGYAIQWWGISALLVFLYVWFQIVRRFSAKRRA
ncbi:SURF1 family protein [Rhodoferax sp.]|uniref:SURF1 family protein n=1 Tax=Rhodoferax sp. TaxID=50421 RepID=UPI0027573D62|nr:SURF1 family protein [Rhodoferax sp.]